jgi:hypothetical protein
VLLSVNEKAPNTKHTVSATEITHIKQKDTGDAGAIVEGKLEKKLKQVVNLAPNMLLNCRSNCIYLTNRQRNRDSKLLLVVTIKSSEEEYEWKVNTPARATGSGNLMEIAHVDEKEATPCTPMKHLKRGSGQQW